MSHDIEEIINNYFSKNKNLFKKIIIWCNDMKIKFENEVSKSKQEALCEEDLFNYFIKIENFIEKYCPLFLTDELNIIVNSDEDTLKYEAIFRYYKYRYGACEAKQIKDTIDKKNINIEDYYKYKLSKKNNINY